MNTNLIKLFNCALVENTNLTFAEVNAKAVLRGYLIHPDVCNESVMKFLDEIAINPNATFYKEWNDVISKSRFELLIDQLIHYSTTYGTDFTEGNGYVPNDGAENVPAFTTLKVIMPISEDELAARCYKLLASGIALKETTMKDCADFIIEHMHKDINVDEIKNREALIYICDAIGKYPTDSNNLFRFIMYKTTGSTMIIKNADTINSIMRSSHQFDFSVLSEENMVALSRIFLRFKDLFLAFKHTCDVTQVKYDVFGRKDNICNKTTSKNAPYINKLRKMAVKNHTPMRPGFWQNIFNMKDQATYDVIQKHLVDLTPYKKVALMQTCLERASGLSDSQIYLVRNQKLFMRKGYKPVTDPEYAMSIYVMLGASLIEDLKKNATKKVTTIDPSTGESIVTETPVVIKKADGVKISLPTSEKSFIGNYPFGTSYDLDADNYFGIYWRGEWGTQDYDLSFLNYNGSKIGWNSSFYDKHQDVIFSGDRTSAYPDAAEVLYIRKNAPKGLIKVNQFRGSSKSKYQFFFGKDHMTSFSNNSTGHMVDPNSIKLTVEVAHENQKEQTLGVVNGNSIVLMAVNTGNQMVSRGRTYQTDIIDNIMHKSTCFVEALPFLEAAGYMIVDDTYTGQVDIDFNNLDKDSLIKLMA